MKMLSVFNGWMLPAVVFLIPWGARAVFLQPRVDGAPVEALTMSFFAVEALVFVVAAVSIAGGARRPSGRGRWAMPLVAFLAWIFLSIFWAPSPPLALQAAVRILAAALLFLLVLRFERRDRLIAAFLVSAALQAAFGLWQAFAHAVPASTLFGVAAQDAAGASAVIESAAGRFLRAYGTLPHPNVLGGFLAVALVFAFADRRQGRTGLLVSAFVPLIAAGLFASFSRSAWLAAAAGTIALAAFLRLDRRFLLRLGAAVTVAAVFALMTWPYVTARVAAQGRLEARSVNERLLALEQSRALLVESPLLGVGIGQTVPALIRRGEPLLEPPHAAPAVLLVELGIVGFLLAIFLMLRLVPRAGALTPVAAALAAAHLPLSLLDHYLITTVPGLLLAAFTLGLFCKEREQGS